MRDKIASLNELIEKYRPRDPTKRSSLAEELQYLRTLLDESRFPAFIDYNSCGCCMCTTDDTCLCTRTCTLHGLWDKKIADAEMIMMRWICGVHQLDEYLNTALRDRLHSDDDGKPEAGWDVIDML